MKVMTAIGIVACFACSGCEDMTGTDSPDVTYTLADGACVVIVDGEGNNVDEVCSSDSSVVEPKAVYVLDTDTVVVQDKNGKVLKVVRKPQPKAEGPQ